MKTLLKYWRVFVSIPVFKNILVLVTGTGIAQVFPIISAPIVARLYTPIDFGTYAIFYSIVTLISGIVFLDYLNAIIIEKHRKEVVFSFTLSFSLLFFISLLLFLIVFIVPYRVLEGLIGKDLEQLVWFLPITIFLNGLSTLLYTWFLRCGMFRLLSKNKLILASSAVVFQVGIGFLKLGALGFIIANLLSLLLSVILFFRAFKNLKYIMFKGFNWKEIWLIALKHKKFPLVTVWSNSLNIFTTQIPQFLINLFFGTNVLGYYSMATRLVSLPLGFISSAVQDVFKQSASLDFAESGNCYKSYRKVFMLLLVVGFFFLICCFTVLPYFFEIFLGENWSVSGKYVQIMSFLFVVRFIAAPLSYVFYITSKQLIDFVWQIFFCLGSYFSLYFGFNRLGFSDPLQLLFFYSIVCGIIYLLNLSLSFKYSKSS